MRHLHACSFFVLLLAILSPRVRADEGMWLYNNPPQKQLMEQYHFEPSAPMARAPAKGERSF